MNSALQITYIIISVLILILVLSQKAKNNGFTTMAGGASGGREVGKTFERKLQVWTTWLVAIYIILSIVFNFLQLKVAKDQGEAFVDQDIYNTEVIESGNDASGSEAEVGNVQSQGTDAIDNE